MRGRDEQAEFRCCGCGSTTMVTMPGGYIALELSPTKVRHVHIDTPTCVCGGQHWVRVGSMTEYYRYHRREDVCRLCNHSVEGTRAFVLRPRGPRLVPEPGVLQLESITVNACPDHVDVLRTDGVMGFFLVE